MDSFSHLIFFLISGPLHYPLLLGSPMYAWHNVETYSAKVDSTAYVSSTNLHYSKEENIVSFVKNQVWKCSSLHSWMLCHFPIWIFHGTTRSLLKTRKPIFCFVLSFDISLYLLAFELPSSSYSCFWWNGRSDVEITISAQRHHGLCLKFASSRQPERSLCYPTNYYHAY